MNPRYAAGLVCVVTDRSQVAHDRSLLDVVAGALEGGARAVLVRERDLPDDERAALVEQVQQLAAPHAALVLTAGSHQPIRFAPASTVCTSGVQAGCKPEPVMQTGVSGANRIGVGVHLRRDETVPDGLDRSSLVVGRSCHDLAELRRACDDGLDHVTLSPVALTASKPGYGPALGVARFRDLVTTIRTERDHVPAILALGGVTAANAGYWVEAGADGVAVMGEVMRAADPEATMRAVVESVAAARELAR